jgi:branched-chain amino acid transport system substrate-binding protein
MQRSKWMRHLAVLAILAIFAAACGGEDTTAPPDDGAATDEPTDMAATDEPTDMAATDEPTDMAATDEPTDMAATDEPTDTGTAPEGAGEADGVLTLGLLLPETGDLAFLGPPEISGVELAVEDMNEAGGVLGEDVALLPGDSGDGDGTVANQTVDRHLAAGADAIIGAAASGISLTVIDKITGAGVIQFSPANTAQTFTEYDDNGLYFRTSPSDILQGRVLAETIVADGGTNVAILSRSDDYGRGLAEVTEAAAIEAGAQAQVFVYDQQAQNFDADVADAAAIGPDAVVLIGFDESARILTTMIENGIGPADVLVYGTDGNRSNDLATTVDPNDPAILTGMRGTSPASEAAPEFIERLLEFNPDLTDTIYSGESYDAAIIIGLAAEVAGTDEPVAVAAEINDVTRPEGTVCTAFAECKELIEAGEEIDYDGVSGPLDFLEAGEIGAATYDIWEINAEGEAETVDQQQITGED